MTHVTAADPLARSHPCFYAGAKGKFGRIHLPAAPACNIQCAYCRRDCDCPNESRPGVASRVVTPEEALDRLERSLLETPHLSVAAVAGPGDAFADPERTLATFALIRRRNSEIALCVSSNGLNIKDSIGALRDLNVRFATITVNALDPAVAARLYQWVVFEGELIRGLEASRLLIERQMEAIALLKESGFVVKVNSVVVPGINDGHMLFLAKRLGRLGIDLMNFVPLIPVPGTELESTPAPAPETMRMLRQKASRYVSQMHHCERCRSDASGLLEAKSL